MSAPSVLELLNITKDTVEERHKRVHVHLIIESTADIFSSTSLPSIVFRGHPFVQCGAHVGLFGLARIGRDSVDMPVRADFLYVMFFSSCLRTIRCQSSKPSPSLHWKNHSQWSTGCRPAPDLVQRRLKRSAQSTGRVGLSIHVGTLQLAQRLLHLHLSTLASRGARLPWCF